MPKHLIVNADDLGIAVSTNLAIQRAFSQGIVTSASLMPNMPAFVHAVDEVLRRRPGLGVGVHLCLTSGRPVSHASQVPLLVDAEGRFRLGFAGLLRLLRSRQRGDALEQIEREWQAQLARVDAAGLALDHIDSHQHVHMIPELFRLAAGMARGRRAAVRIADERFHGAWDFLAGLPRRLFQGGILKKTILSWMARRARPMARDAAGADHYVGVLDTGRMTCSVWHAILASLGDGVTEVNVHPGLPDQLDAALESNAPDARFLRSRHRAAELEALVDPELRAEINRRAIALVRFADVQAR